MDRGAEVTEVLDLKDMSRCVACRRLVTLRRILSLGHCKCGSRKLIEATFLDEDDLLEIEEDYGWEVKITGVGEHNVSKGLLQSGERSETSPGTHRVEINEARLHSRRAEEFRARRSRQHGILGVKNWWHGVGFSRRFSTPQQFNDFIRSLRKPQFFFGKRHA